MSRKPPSLRTCLAVVAVVLVLAGLERGARILVSHLLPSRGAQWIWVSDAKLNRPVIFYAVKEFDLETRPSQAHVRVLGDEEYVLFLNGKRIASNSYLTEAPLDEYEVAPLLEAGPNRLVAELRSRRGAGGFLAALFVADMSRPVVVTDATWGILRRHRPGLLVPWLPLPASERALVWQSPPTGRWGFPTRDQTGPRTPQRFDSHLSVAAHKVHPSRKVGCKWAPEALMAEGPASSPCSFLLDWGREVTGYLELEVEARPGRAYAVYTGVTPPDPRQEEATTHLIPMPGLTTWCDSVPRRFRYARVVGVGEVVSARTVTVEESEVHRGGVVQRGLFGIDPPRY